MPTSETDPNIKIAELIEKFLKEEKMTPAQLASYLNVAETTVHRWLKGESKPTGTAAAILWTLIGLGGLTLGVVGPLAGPGRLLSGASLGARLLRSTTIGAGVISSGIGIYQLLKRTLEKAGVNDLETVIEAIKQKDVQEQKVKALREKLEEEERKLRELEQLAGKEV